MCSMSGYWTFTATSRPSCSRARCTCASEADASGLGSKLENTASSGFASSLSTTPRITSKARGGTRSWARCKVRTYSGGNTSERVPTTWHTFKRSPRRRVAVR